MKKVKLLCPECGHKGMLMHIEGNDALVKCTMCEKNWIVPVSGGLGAYYEVKKAIDAYFVESILKEE